MAFVRIKRIKGKEYAYLVENTWVNKRSKQKVLKYLGSVYRPMHKELTSNAEAETYEALVDAHILNTLEHMGFETVGKHMVYDGVRIDLDDRKLTRNSKPVVIKVNEGFLSHDTWEHLRSLTHRTDERKGESLAKAVLEAGLSISQEQFIKLYEFLTKAS